MNKDSNSAQICESSYDLDKMNRMYRFPAITKEADVHARATKFGYNSPYMSDGSETPICPCC